MPLNVSTRNFYEPADFDGNLSAGSGMLKLYLYSSLVFTFIVVAVLAGMVARKGLRIAALALVGGAVGSISIAFLSMEINASNWLLLVVSTAVAMMVGVWVSLKGFTSIESHQLWDQIKSKFSVLSEDFRVRVITIAFCAALVLTCPFGIVAFTEPKDSFWFGFYQSWTAGLVAFVLLGAGSTLVSLYRPEKDHFTNRIRILFGAYDADTTTYLTTAVRALGYYSESMERQYIIEKYDASRGAYFVRIRHSTLSKNFLHDVNTPDRAVFSITPDKFEPPIEVIGHLLKFNIGAQQMVDAPIPIPQEGKRVEHDIRIPINGTVAVYLEYVCFFKAGEKFTFRPARYSKEMKARIENALESGGALSISSMVPSVANKITLPWGRSHELGPVSHVAPQTEAFTFVVHPP